VRANDRRVSFLKKIDRDGPPDDMAGEQGTARVELSAHLSNFAFFRRALISMDWVPRGVWAKATRYVVWEDEGLRVGWLRMLRHVFVIDANPIEPVDKDEACETPC